MNSTERKQKAAELGREAFAIGLDQIAALDPAFKELMVGVPLATADSLEPLQAWRTAWERARLEKQFRDATAAWQRHGWYNSDRLRDERNTIATMIDLCR